MSTDPTIDVLIFIPTSNNDFLRRCGCRDTWLNLVKSPEIFNCRECTGLNIKYYFILDSIEPMEKNLIEEQDIFNDIIFLPSNGASSHKFIFNKMQHMFKYAVEHFKFHILFKIDPDTYIHVDRFVPYILNILNSPHKEDLYIGSISTHWPVPGRETPYWGDPNFIDGVGSNEYFTHSKGAAYGISYNLAEYIGSPPGPLLIFPAEDVQVGAAVSALNVSLRMLPTNIMGPVRANAQYHMSLDSFSEDFTATTTPKRFIVEHYHKPHTQRAKFLYYLLSKSIKENAKNKPQNYIKRNICFVDLFNDAKQSSLFGITHNIFNVSHVLNHPNFDMDFFTSQYLLLISKGQCSLPIVNYKWKKVTDNIDNKKVFIDDKMDTSTNTCWYCEYDGSHPPIWMKNIDKYKDQKSMAADLLCYINDR